MPSGSPTVHQEHLEHREARRAAGASDTYPSNCVASGAAHRQRHRRRHRAGLLQTTDAAWAAQAHARD